MRNSTSSPIAKTILTIPLPRDMANIPLDWEVEGILTPEESVSAMLRVIPTKTVEQSGTFWTWEGKVCHSLLLSNH